MNSETVLLIRNVKPKHYGGGELYQIVLAEELKKHGFWPVVVTASKELLAAAKRKKIEAVESLYLESQIWSGWRNFLLPVYIFKLKKLGRWYKELFEKYQPSTINVQSRDDYIIATLVAKKMGVRVLWTDHAEFQSWIFQNMNVWYKNWIGKMIVAASKKADKIIVISDFEKKQVSKMIAPRKMKNMTVINNGVIDRVNEYKKIKPKKNSFVFIGRLVRDKGVFELIEAFRKVVEKYPEARLNIYGEGEDAKLCREAAKGCSGIVFHGYTDEPLRVLAENDCFVLPSYHEGLSLSLLEAAMMEKTIIASNVEGNLAVIKDRKTGLLVPVEDSEKLAEKMLEVVEDRGFARELAKNAREYYEENFDFDKVFVEKMLPLYNKEKEEK